MDENNLKVKLNQADSETLQSLPRLGKTLADRIVERREQVGPIRDLGELMEIKGISEAIVERIAGRVDLSTTEREAPPSEADGPQEELGGPPGFELEAVDLAVGEDDSDGGPPGEEPAGPEAPPEGVEPADEALAAAIILPEETAEGPVEAEPAAGGEPELELEAEVGSRG
jgi:hypothetical protein